jgi:hypothetical protein
MHPRAQQGSSFLENGHNGQENHGKWTKIILHSVEALSGTALAVFSWRR